MTGMSATTTGTTKNRMRSTSDVSQNDVYRCQNVGPERGRRERQIVGPLGGKLTEPIERPRRRGNLADRFQQQILQRRVQVLSHQQAIAGSERTHSDAARHANGAGPLIARVLHIPFHFGASFIFWRTSSRLKLAAFCR